MAKHTDVLAAISILLDRAYGRPQQPIDMAVKYENLNPEELTDAELTAIIRGAEAEERELAKVKVRNGSATRPY